MKTIHHAGQLLALLFVFLFAAVPHGLAQEDLADVIQRCEASVVRIEVTGTRGDGLGSGFIVSPDGLLVTNVHVLAGASKAVAFFADGKSFNITGTRFIDENRDICVAKIEATGLPVISVAHDLPRKGEQVIALGSPKGLSFSATRGIVSAVRDEQSARKQIGRPNMKGTWIQIDAALSGGNSGGPLINKDGEVVAMSTLASTGSAQNLNFGISAEDIAVGIERAKKANLVSLKAGVGKVDMGEVSPESGEMITRAEIPASALEDYVERGRGQYTDLTRDIRKAATEARSVLSEMKKGETYIPGGSGGYDVVVSKGRSTDKYFFRSDAVKRREVTRQQSLATRLGEVRNNLGNRADDNSLFALLLSGGPILDPRNANSIGFMSEGIVLHAFNEHDVAVLYDGVPYMMWVKSTTGLSAGQKLTPGPVYVAGTTTIEIPGRGQHSVTILNSVTETEVKDAIFGFRTWTDNTGTYSVEAKFKSADESKVVLEKVDGSLLEVPLDKLSEQDRSRIGK